MSSHRSFWITSYCPRRWNRISHNQRNASENLFSYGPLARYVKLRVTHAPEMPGTFVPPPRVSDPDMHHGTCVTHVSWCMPGSLTRGFLWRVWREKHSRLSRRMHNPQFYVPGKRPIQHNAIYLVQAHTHKRCLVIYCLLIFSAEELMLSWLTSMCACMSVCVGWIGRTPD